MADRASHPSAFDLHAYLRRIGFSGDVRPSYPVLEALHLAHATHIPFENLDILLGRPIRLDLDSLQAKIVKGGRGGYCFEQNLLFAAALRELGFSVTNLAARVRYGTHEIRPRTHMLLLVRCDDDAWIADVGFGGDGLLLPVPLRSKRETRQFVWTYRVVEEAGQWVLQYLHSDLWADLYAFTLEPQELADFELANYYTSTHPNSRFVRNLTVQLSRPQARTILRNRELIVDDGKSLKTRMIEGETELLDVLVERFDLRFPLGTRFPLPGDQDVAPERPGKR